MSIQPFQKRILAEMGLDVAECNYHEIRSNIE